MNLHSTRSLKYSYVYVLNDPNKFFYLFFAYEYQKYKEFYADSKSFKMVGKITLKKLFARRCLVVELFTDKLRSLLSTERTVYWSSQLYKKEQVSGLVIYADPGLYLNSATVLIPTYVI
jgi:hypothetical protein